MDSNKNLNLLMIFTLLRNTHKNHNSGTDFERD